MGEVYEGFRKWLIISLGVILIPWHIANQATQKSMMYLAWTQNP
jgi:hypothetical protein